MKKYIFATFVIFLFSNSFVDTHANTISGSLYGTSQNILQRRSDAEKAYQEGNHKKSISIWLNLLKVKDIQPDIKAEIYSNIAALYYQKGLPRKSILFWQQAISIYRQDKTEKSKYLLAAVLLDKAQAHNSIGQSRFSKSLLKEGIKISIEENFTKLESIGQQALGNAHTISAEYDEAILSYLRSLELATKLDNVEIKVVALNNLANIHNLKYQQLDKKANSAKESRSLIADDLFQQSLDHARKSWNCASRAVKESKSSSSLFSVKAIIQLIQLYQEYSEQKIIKSISIQPYLKIASEKLQNLPNSQRKVQVLIELANLNHKKLVTLKHAVRVAYDIGNLRSQSLALGHLGKYYEREDNYDRALAITEKARMIAGKIQAVDLLYRWDWQTGRILSRIGKNESSQLAYQHSIASLQLIRNQIALSGNSEINIDFKLEVEPVYRELLELMLKERKVSDQQLSEVLDIRDLLQLSELENFFGNDCIITKKVSVKENQKTTVINTIILDDHTYLLAELPNGQNKKISIPITAQEINKKILEWRYHLENRENEKYLSLSKDLYSLLIKPIENELLKTKTKKLVFNNDGILRNVPMAALHDGKKFLIEKYTIANSLGFDIRQKNNEFSETEILAFGLSSGSSDFISLPYVRTELSQLKKVYRSNNFLDEEFNIDNFNDEASKGKYNVLHIATHAKFDGTIDQTYLQAYNDTISLKNLEKILNQRGQDKKIELLILSACSTAVGSSRATLGLSGIAIRSNINYVLGTLWSVSDEEIVVLISYFYRYWLEEKYSKSEALRLAQLELLKSPDFHPGIWASLILIQS